MRYFVVRFICSCVFALTTATLVGAQTPNIVPVYTSSSTFGDSPIYTSEGNVGIGTTAPTGRLEVKSSSGSDSVIMRLSTPESPINSSLDIVWLGYQGISGAENVAFRVGYPYAYGVSSGNPLDLIKLSNGSTIFSTDSSNTPLGNVGIGTTSPGARLEVNGSVKLTAGTGASMTYADGTQQSTAWTGVLSGGDYAESVDVTGERTEFEPGDLLVIDPKAHGHFKKANTPYSTLVGGVYATKPGVTGRRQPRGKSQEEEVPMAMVGIVPTKVSTENGPIHDGDLLVSSSIPGYAMKGTDDHKLTGAVLGKALGALESGQGVIEVLISLQ